MSQSFGDSTRTTSQPLGTTSARLVAVKLKSANKNIFRALMSLGSANLVQRLMGLVNSTIVTASFGQGEAMDAYAIATILPLTLSDLLSGAIEAAVIPTYTSLRAKGSREKASRLFSTLINILVVGTLLFTMLALVFRDPLVSISAPGKTNTNELSIAISLSLYAFPILFFKVLNSFLEALLNAEGQYGWPAYAGMLNPLVTAIFVLLGGKSLGVVMLCVGGIAGAIAELSIILVRANKAKLKYTFTIDLSMPEVQKTAQAALPALSAGIISVASPYVDLIFSSFLPQIGNIAALNNAQKLNGVPTGVVLSAVGRAALPYLAAQAAIKDMKAFKQTLRLYLWAVTAAAIFIALVMGVFSHVFVELLFRHGQYTADDVNLAAITLTGLVIGLPPMAVGWIISRAFSALGKTRILMYISIFSVVANAVFDAIFGRLWGVFGIAFATSMVYVCTMIILVIAIQATIGAVNLLTPPKELFEMPRNLLARFHERWLDWKDENMADGLSYEYRKQLTRFIITVIFFAVGVGLVVYVDVSHQTVILVPAVAFGILLILAWLRYPFFLLLCWAVINPFIGSTLPLFNGAHFLSGFTVPTLLLLFWVPTRKAFKRMPMLPFFLVYFLWMILGLNISPITTSTFLTTWTTFLDYVGVAVIAVLYINSRKRLLMVIDAMMIPTIVIAIYGIIGYVTKTNGVVDTTTGYFRIASIFGDVPPTMALYMSITIPLAAYRVISLRGFKLLGGLAMLLLFFVSWGLTFDRSSQITMVLSALLIVPFLPTKTLRNTMVVSYISVAALAILAAVIFNIPIFSRFTNSDIGTLNGRTELWTALLQRFDPTALLGYGHGASDFVLQNIKVGFAGGVVATAAHNIYLEAMFETGLIGVALMLLAFAVLGISLLLRAFKASKDRRLLIAFALAAFIGVMIQSYASNDIWIQEVGIPFMIFMALPFALCWTKEEETLEAIEQPGHVAAEPGENIGKIEPELAPV